MTPSGNSPTDGFPPIEGVNARRLILGSLPGEASVRAGQYYAHPRNAFWGIMAKLFGADGSYSDRVRILKSEGVMVWDVLKRSVRPGSLDARIRMDTAIPNNFAALFERQPDLTLIACNGGKAYDLFRRFVTVPTGIDVVRLPSSSPAYAAMSFETKLEAWRSALKTTGGSR